LAGAIRGQLREETEKPSAKPILDKGAGANLYVAVTAAGYVPGEYGDVKALENAEQDLVNRLRAFDYENQNVPA